MMGTRLGPYGLDRADETDELVMSGNSAEAE